MDEPRPFASLTPTLLARKGGARPAMRPHLQTTRQFHEATALQLDEDLAWNDLGEDVPSTAPQSGEVVAINPGVAVAPREAPEVVQQRDSIAARLAEPSRPARPRRSALAQGGRAAFTLRLDADRHLKLRLACTIANRSAQQLVTEALDRLIAELPDVATLAAEVRKRI